MTEVRIAQYMGVRIAQYMGVPMGFSIQLSGARIEINGAKNSRAQCAYKLIYNSLKNIPN